MKLVCTCVYVYYIYIYILLFQTKSIKGYLQIPSIRQNLAEFPALEANAVLIAPSTTPNVVESNYVGAGRQ
jgi:hypothetical protein